MSVPFPFEKQLNPLAKGAKCDKDLKVTSISKSHKKIIGQIEERRPIHNLYKHWD